MFLIVFKQPAIFHAWVSVYCAAPEIFLLPRFLSVFFLASTSVSSCSPDGRSLPVSHGSDIPIWTFLDPSYNMRPHPQSFIELALGFVASMARLSGLGFHFKGLNQSLSHLLLPRFKFHTPTEQKIKSMIHLFFLHWYSLQYVFTASDMPTFLQLPVDVIPSTTQKPLPSYLLHSCNVSFLCIAKLN